MADATIRHKVDLAVSFLDRTTGMPVAGSVSLTRDGKNAHFRMSPDGIALFANTGREDFELGVNVSGYEREDVKVEYAALDERLPYMEVYMIPQDVFYESCTTVSGFVKGLAAVDAVCVEAPAWIVSNFDARKRLLTVQNIYKKQIESRYYGIIANDRNSYTPIEILEKVSGDTYRTDIALAGEVSGLRLAYRVTGRVRGGTCLLRIPNRGGRKTWIIRADAEKKSQFRLFDIDEANGRPAGRQIGIDEIMSRAAPGIVDAHEYDADMEGG